MPSTDDGIGLPAASGIRVLEASGMLDTMLHLRDVGQCKKTDLYGAIGKRTGMAPKLDRLERAGLIVQERHPRMTLLFLTGDGRAVADMIERIRRVIGEGEVRGDHPSLRRGAGMLHSTGSGTRKNEPDGNVRGGVN